MKIRRLLVFSVAGLILTCGWAEAQTVETQVPPDTLVQRDYPSPRAAFLRSLVVPGWGQLALGAPLRAGVYFVGDLGNWFMLVKTQRRIGDARDREVGFRRDAEAALRERAETDPALAERITNPDTLRALIAADPGVAGARSLVDSRKEQREDWIAWTVFWTVASAADAYVAAQLSDFPGRVGVRPHADGGVLVYAQVPLPLTGRRR